MFDKQSPFLRFRERIFTACHWYLKGISKQLFIHCSNVQTLDVVQVKNIGKKAKNPCRWSKISLHKNFKLILEQNVTEQTYPKISCRWLNCSFQSLIQQFYLVNWILISKMSWTKTFQRVWFQIDFRAKWYWTNMS